MLRMNLRYVSHRTIAPHNPVSHHPVSHLDTVSVAGTTPRHFLGGSAGGGNPD